jgi:glucosamine--fructose-6-phosphate aminotransferase (isomerizing)
MCGIVGYVGNKPLLPVIMEGLRKLEYRGYDSAGVAVVKDGQMVIRRSAGKLSKLDEVLAKDPIDGEYGIGHTRWATHGRPTEENAHPHRDCKGKIVVVHNGIIENYLELKRELTAKGHKFVTQTDTEIVAHLVEQESRGDGLVAAVRRALTQLRGLFALVLISADEPNTIVTVRNGPPVVVGLGKGEYFVASDIPAILSHTRDVIFLGDREIAVITKAGVAFTNFEGQPISKEPQHVTWDPVMGEKAGYPHFMLKEIHEQPVGGSRNGARPHVGGNGHRLPARNGPQRLGAAIGAARRDSGLRHVVARRPGGEVPHRRTRAAAGRSGLQLGVPVPPSDRCREDAGDCDHAVWRNRRHARRAA